MLTRLNKRVKSTGYINKFRLNSQIQGYSVTDFKINFSSIPVDLTGMSVIFWEISLPF